VRSYRRPLGLPTDAGARPLRCGSTAPP